MQPDHNVIQIIQPPVEIEEEQPLNIRDDDDSGEMNDGDDDDSYKSCNEEQQNAK